MNWLVLDSSMGSLIIVVGGEVKCMVIEEGRLVIVVRDVEFK